MREALRRLVGRTGIELPELATFRSQAGDDQGNIPDLIGLDATGAERLLIENKFWAGLTGNQPAGYLDRLPAEGGAVLLFVVPSKRLPILWPELAVSALTREMRLPDPQQLPGDLLFARLTSSTALATTSWAAVLDSLEAAARASGETSATADIAQLRSLCDAMDGEAFLPVRMEELTNLEVPRCVTGLINLIRDFTAQAVAASVSTELVFLAQSLRIVFDLGAVDDPAFLELRSHRPILPAVARIEIPVTTPGPTPVHAVFHNGVEQYHVGGLVIRAADDVLVRDFGHGPGETER
jgi:hypothetical protein